MAHTVTSATGVFDICRRFTPFIEQMSIDEAFLDVGGVHHLFGTSSDIATNLRKTVRSETGLVLSIGAARTKYLAKVASQVAKPDGIVVVDPDHELRFLHRLHVRYLWGAGPVMQERLADMGLNRIGEVAATPVESLQARLGRGTARHLHAGMESGCSRYRDGASCQVRRFAKHIWSGREGSGDLPPHPGEPCRQGRGPAAYEAPGRANPHRACAVRRFSVDHALDDVACACFIVRSPLRSGV